VGSGVVVAHSLQESRRVVADDVDERVVVGSEFSFTGLEQGFGSLLGFSVVNLVGLVTFSFEQDFNALLEGKVCGNNELGNGFGAVLEELEDFRVAGWNQRVNHIL